MPMPLLTPCSLLWTLDKCRIREIYIFIYVCYLYLQLVKNFEWEIHICKLKNIFIGTQRVVDYKIPNGTWYSSRLE